MSRALVQFLLPILLPTVLFVVWLAFTHYRGGADGDVLTRFRDGPWFWLVLSGFVLMIGGLAYTGLTRGTHPGGTYVAPHVEGGRIVPGHVD